MVLLFGRGARSKGLVGRFAPLAEVRISFAESGMNECVTTLCSEAKPECWRLDGHEDLSHRDVGESERSENRALGCAADRLPQLVEHFSESALVRREIGAIYLVF